MNIEDLDLEEEDIVDAKYKNCIAIFNATEDRYIGTGFIIDETGKFLSAGHNFKEADIKYKAVYNEKEYEIETIYHEYNEIDKDLFIGCLVDFKDIIDNTFTFGRTDQLSLNHPLYILGFNSRIYSGTSECVQVNGHILYMHNILTQLTTLQDRKDILPIRHKVDNRLHCAYVKLLDLPNPERYSGLSGSPVYYQNEIYGVCIADMFITMDYIMKFL